MKYKRNKISQGKQGRGCGIRGTIRLHKAGPVKYKRNKIAQGRGSAAEG